MGETFVTGCLLKITQRPFSLCLKKAKLVAVTTWEGIMKYAILISLKPYVQSSISIHAQALGSYAELIQFVPDRPGHDARYAIDPNRIWERIGLETHCKHRGRPESDHQLVFRQRVVVEDVNHQLRENAH